MPFIAFDLLFNNRIPVNVSVYAHNGILSYEFPASSYLHNHFLRKIVGSTRSISAQYWIFVNLQDATEAFINLQVYPILPK